MTDQIWERQRLRYICKINPIRGKKDSLPTYTEASFIPMECIGDQGSLSLERSKPIKDISSGYTYFEDGDVIFAKITPCFENGKGALATKLINEIAFGTTELHILRPSASTVGKFIYYLTCSEDFRRTGEAWMYGAGGQKRVPEDFVKDYSLLLPPPYIQKIIASYLDKETTRIDALIEKKQRQIELLKEKRQAIITRAVTRGLDPNAKMKGSGVEWIGEIPEGWKVRKLKALSRRITKGTTPSTIGEEVLPTGDVRFIKAENITQDNKLETEPAFYISNATHLLLGRSIIQGNDIVFVIAGATIGKVALVDKEILPANTNQAVCIISPNPMVEPKYLFLFLQSDLIKKAIELDSVQSAQPNLSMEDIGNFAVPIPDRNAQRGIVAIVSILLSESEQVIAKIRNSLSLLLELRSSLITAAVSGQIDVTQEIE